jgi:hypothetical protein
MVFAALPKTADKPVLVVQVTPFGDVALVFKVPITRKNEPFHAAPVAALPAPRAV